MAMPSQSKTARGCSSLDQAPLGRESLHEERDLPVLNDLRGVLGAQMTRVFGLGRRRSGACFPGEYVPGLRR
jgi:hypothetical protein